MNANNLAQGPVPFEHLDEDEQMDMLISALRQHGKIIMPISERFEHALKNIRLSSGGLTVPNYT